MAIAKAIESEFGRAARQTFTRKGTHCAQLENDNVKKTIEIAAEKAGFSNETTCRQISLAWPCIALH